MQVKVIHVNQDTGAEEPAGECDLSACFDRDDPEFIDALGELERQGRYWGGGGAAALFLLIRK